MTLGALGLAGCGDSAMEQVYSAASGQSTNSPSPDPPSITRLFVLNAGSGAQSGDRLFLYNVPAELVYFEDRPGRSAGRLTTADLVADWEANGFTDDPPNALLQIGLGEGASTHAFELFDPAYDANSGTLSFRVVLDTGEAGGPAPASFGPAVLFIDNATGYSLSQTRVMTLTFQAGDFQVTLAASGSLRFTIDTGDFGSVSFATEVNLGDLGSVRIYPHDIVVSTDGGGFVSLAVLGTDTTESITLTATGNSSVIFDRGGGVGPTLTTTPTIIPWTELDRI